MRKLFFIFIIGLFLSGCAGWSWENAPVNNTVGYFGGKGVSILVHESVKKDTTIPRLEAKYDEFMLQSVDMEIIPPEMSIALYNDLLLILAGETDDPYGLIADLTFLLGQFGAQFAMGDNKTMVGIDPIPRAVYASFEIGWDQGKFVYENELADAD
jgi:hypothetical protein